MKKFDLAVIGAGPGGYVAAIRAAQKGMEVVCIEKEKTLGGTCLNVGCIPSKSLLHSTEYYHKIATEGKEHGIECSGLSINFAQMMARKQGVVASLTGGIDYLFKKNKVHHYRGEATLLSATRIQVGHEEFEVKNIILATGSEPIPLPFLPFDEERVLSSTGALALKTIPKKMVIVGAGIIGLELGSVYRRLGCEVEVIELLDRVVATLDKDVSKSVEQIFKKQGFLFQLKTKIRDGKVEKDGVTLFHDRGQSKAEVVLVAIGRRPYFKNLSLEKLGIVQDKQGRVVVDHHFRSSIPNIYAIGDLVDGPMLAHKASEEGIAVVDMLAGEKIRLNYLVIPNVMYTWPEVAAVGMTEQEALEAGLELLVGKMPFKAISRARCSGDTDGMVKIVGDKRTGRVIGLHIVGPNASEMIHEGVVAIEHKLTLTQLGRSSHAHPTNSEAIKEAAFAALGTPLHL